MRLIGLWNSTPVVGVAPLPWGAIPLALAVRASVPRQPTTGDTPPPPPPSRAGSPLGPGRHPPPFNAPPPLLRGLSNPGTYSPEHLQRREESCPRGWGGGHRGPSPPPSLAAVPGRGSSARGVPYLPCQGGGSTPTSIFLSKWSPTILTTRLSKHCWWKKVIGPRHATGVGQRNWSSIAIGPVSKDTQ